MSFHCRQRRGKGPKDKVTAHSKGHVQMMPTVETPPVATVPPSVVTTIDMTGKQVILLTISDYYSVLKIKSKFQLTKGEHVLT